MTGVRISDQASLIAASDMLLSRGVAAVVITLGARGAFLAERGRIELIEACEVNAIDTTAAGDVFNGALAVALGERKSLHDAVRFANAAAALSVTKIGAQPSAPSRSAIDELVATVASPSRAHD